MSFCLVVILIVAIRNVVVFWVLGHVLGRPEESEGSPNNRCHRGYMLQARRMEV